MRDSARQTRSHLVRLFEQQGVRPRHDLGQNFLVDLNLLDLIVRQARLSTADVVLEVGAGTGSLTERLARAAGHVVSVECDPHVFGHLRQLLGSHPRVTLIHGDALESKHALSPEVLAALRSALRQVAQAEAQQAESLAGDCGNPWALQARDVTCKLVANLPYHIATPVISNLVASDLPWSRMVVTIQWELAERMQARPGTSDYGALSVWLQAQTRINVVRKLPPSVFWPPPKVDSAVVVIERDAEAQAAIADRALFHQFVREVFTQRRKRLLGVLAGRSGPEPSGERRSDPPGLPARRTRAELQKLFAELGIVPEARAEELAVGTLVQLANRLAAPS
uniref:Ribosomal RNA small subunit methyltransferase A n=1 Tax=Schlesneria paludicola TaxID=360056 RepID=A0A7C4LLY6_9PLAN